LTRDVRVVFPTDNRLTAFSDRGTAFSGAGIRCRDKNDWGDRPKVDCPGVREIPGFSVGCR
jgi:hypothetical protein